MSHHALYRFVEGLSWWMCALSGVLAILTFAIAPALPSKPVADLVCASSGVACLLFYIAADLFGSWAREPVEEPPPETEQPL